MTSACRSSLVLSATILTAVITGPRISSLASEPLRSVARHPDERMRARIDDRYGHLPLAFEGNAGQTDISVDFLSRGKGYTLFLTRGGGATLVVPRATPVSKADLRHISGAVLRVSLVGSAGNGRGEGQQQLPGTVSYLRGSDRNAWRSNVPTFGRVRYANVYEGIDLAYYGNQRELEYDFLIHPGGDPDRIRLRFDGADVVSVEPSGHLAITIAGHTLVQRPPIIYQDISGARSIVAGRYVVEPNGDVTFRVADYDETSSLVIDPVLVYSTFLGGSLQPGDAGATAIATDDAGASYVAGSTSTVDFPHTAGAFDATPNGSSDVFVAKLSTDGTTLIYGTYLGGSGADGGPDIAVDTAGSVYVSGFTDSTNFPTTPGAHDRTKNGGDDVFIAKLSPDGSSLEYGTYLGGNAQDCAAGIAVGPSGNAYVAGCTYSADFPTTAGAYDTTWNEPEAFVVKVNSAGDLAYSTFLGGTDADFGDGIAVDATGAAYVIGHTASNDFPTTPGARDESSNGSLDVFVAKLSTDGAALEYATYLGGADQDVGQAIAVDATGALYVSGYTQSVDFPTTPGAYDETGGGFGAGQKVFLAKLGPDGSSLVFGTCLGGNNYDYGGGIALDADGGILVTGYTASSDFPTTAGAYDTSWNGDYDAFVTRFNADGSTLIYSTFVGGGSGDYGSGIAVDTLGRAHIAGSTQSFNFPTTPGAFDASFTGSSDAFVGILDSAGAHLDYATYLGGSIAGGEDSAAGIAVDATGAAYITGWTYSTNFPTSGGAYDSTKNNRLEAFITKLSPGGDSVIYSTYLGGRSDDQGTGVAVDASGSAYVTGYTNSEDFPTTIGAYDTTWNGGSSDAFIARLSPDGANLEYATLLGGSSGEDRSAGIAVDGSGNAYVTGHTDSSDFPTTPGAYNSTWNGSRNAFVAKLSHDGAALLYGTYLGGSSDELGYAMRVPEILTPTFPEILAH